jgi:hypothetical protein
MCRRWADNVGLSPHREFDHRMSEDASNVFIVGYVSQAKLHPILGCAESPRNFNYIRVRSFILNGAPPSA